MALHESGEMYLETILELSLNNPKLRSIDIATRMNYSKPSVSRAIKQLKESDLIDVSSNGEISLTNKGLDIANKIYERHNLLSDFLIGIGVNKDKAIEDACKIEHYISDESINALKEYMKKKVS